jgi:hypothetical protein
MTSLFRPEAGAAAQQLTLGPLPAVYQDPVTSGLDQKCGVIAFRGWDAR